MRGRLILPALAAVLASPAAAEKLDARAMLVASTPAKDSTVEAGLDTITLTFAEPAEVISVTLRLPDDSEMAPVPEAPARRGRQKDYRYRLLAPLEQPGSYAISYLLISKSFKSLNGFIDFQIAGEEPVAASEYAAEPETEE